MRDLFKMKIFLPKIYLTSTLVGERIWLEIFFFLGFNLVRENATRLGFEKNT